MYVGKRQKEKPPDWDLQFESIEIIFVEKQTISDIASILSSPIVYLKGVGPHRAEMLQKELSIFTFLDLLEHFPIRHINKKEVKKIQDILPGTEYIQVAGRLMSFEVIGKGKGRRLVAALKDDTGWLELTWFRGLNWVQKTLTVGQVYLVFGRTGFFQGKPQIIHPEMEAYTPENAEGKDYLEPIYPSTEKLKSKGLSGRKIGKLTKTLLDLLKEKDIPENLPEKIVQRQKFLNRFESFQYIHFPPDEKKYSLALKRLKFEELFIAQVRIGLVKANRHRYSKGVVFSRVGDLFNAFYHRNLPFQLTGAQKRVLKEIRLDTARGHQMNRLLQGDVGSGKTIVALLCMLIAADNNYQSCMMSPTEILARQHFNTICSLLKETPVSVRLLTGSVKGKERKEILEQIQSGEIHILVGTHAVIEEKVQFSNLGLAVVDEQHRFGVAQRAQLWGKSETPPHILVMTATPIPRTLAMTAYGDLDYSVLDELPPGRQPIATVHRYDNRRPAVMNFVRSEISKGRQAYFIFPLIEESEKLNYENLMRGYEEVKSFFPEPRYWISMVHGRQSPEVKDTNMQRFVSGDTQIMVSTTVIEVGVDVPNATVMVIESAEKFGLSQLHQLRGRVGRGSEKSFCILLTGSPINNEARERIRIMSETNDGFRISEKDLELRGPGDIEGTRQSGMLNFKLASIVYNKDILGTAKKYADMIINTDPELNLVENLRLKEFLRSQNGKTQWSRIS